MNPNTALADRPTQPAPKAKRSGRFRSAALLLLALMLVGAFAVSCSESDSANSDDSGGTDSMAAERLTSGDAEQGESAPVGEPVSIADASRDVIYTGSVSLTVDDPLATQKEAALVAKAAGGVVFGQSVERGDDFATVTMVFKLPTNKFDEVVASLSELGELEASNKSADDVTDQLVDLESRIASAQRSVERVRVFLDDARDINQLSTLEAELTRRETDLERLVAQERQLAEQTAQATLTLTVRQDASPVADDDSDDDELPGFAAAFGNGVDALTEALGVVAAIVGYALPFAVLAAMVLALVKLGIRVRSPKLAAAPLASETDG